MFLKCEYCDEQINQQFQSYTWLMVDGVARPVHVSDRWDVKSCDYLMRKQQREAENELNELRNL